MEKFDVKEVLEKTKTIAIVGLSEKVGRTSNRIGKYLMTNGKYLIIPVNPNIEEVFGQKAYGSLSEIPADIKIDLVSVFRRSEFLEELAREAVERGVGAFWAQLGIYNEKAEMILKEANIPHIMNTCIFVEHQNYF